MKRKRDCPGVGNGKVGPQAGYIDDHPDFWRYHPRGYGSIDESMAWLRPDFLPSDREPGLRRKGGSGVGTGPGAASTRRDAMAARSGFGSVIHPWGGGMGRSEISAIGSPWEALAANPELVGIRPIVPSEPDDRCLLQPEFPRYMAMLEEFGLACDILPYPRHLGVAVEFARRFPGQRFILDHFAKLLIEKTAKFMAGRRGSGNWRRFRA